MDIDLLSKMVKELILDQDRVVLPGLGSFVAEIVPSTFSDKGYTINPPYRRLFFRSRPDEGDDLTSFYASSNNVELDIADRIIKDFVKELKSVLHEKKTVVFPGLGRLRATKENHVFFVADESLDIYPAGFGLEPISLKTHQETVEEVSAAVVGLKSMLTEPVPVIEPQPVVKTEPQIVVKSEPSTDQQSDPTPIPAVEPVKASVVDPAPAVAPAPAVEPVPVVEHAPVTEPAPKAEPAPVAKPAPVPESVPVHEPVHTKPAAAEPVKPSRTGLKVAIWVLAAASAAMIAFAVLGRTCPDFVDSFLYTPEELEIVKML